VELVSATDVRTDPKIGASIRRSPRGRRAISMTHRDARTMAAVGLFLLPALALVAVLMIAPFVDTIYRSFYNDNGFTRTWVGLHNYRTLVDDPAFGRSVVNTLMWVAGTLLLPVLLGLLLAVGTNSLRWGSVARFSLILPYALSGSATAVVWTFVLRSDGALNDILHTLAPGVTPPGWLTEWPLNTVMMILASTWQGTGAAVILFLVGLQAIPTETIEAAQLDGAHVEYMRGISNPIGVKVGTAMDSTWLQGLVTTLNPQNQPGRLTLIHRFGAKDIEASLPRAIEAVRQTGQAVLWICDPMHGNTETAAGGLKTRRFENILKELDLAFRIHADMGSYLGGVHIELTGEDVTECTGGARGLTDADLQRAYRSSVDPRLNHEQALELAMLIAERSQTRRADKRERAATQS